MRLVILVVLILPTWGAHAALYCTKPSKPYCAEGYGRFSDDYDFQSCRSEMESYKSSIERYIRCVIDEAESDVSKARSEYNSAVESFNSRARSAY